MNRNETRFLYGDTVVHKRNRLPHWETSCGIYFVTYCLVDAIPAMVRQQIARERAEREKEILTRSRILSIRDMHELDRQSRHRIEEELDRGEGRCELAIPRLGEMVYDAFRYFHRQRYDLSTLSVMPNHVHIVFRLRPGWSLSRVLHSWKSFTAKKALELLGRDGPFWQEDYYDRLIRNRSELERTNRYVMDNPIKANLRNWPWVAHFESEID